MRHYQFSVNADQNKNRILLIKFAYFLTHESKFLDRVSFTFPGRGYSYMESDKKFGVVKLNTRMDLPKHFYNLSFQPFIVVNEQETDSSHVGRFSIE